MKTGIRLSQCMIVKNEEENIERALGWGKGVVSEQIVVDTGSTDRTVELAKGMGAKVYEIEWKNDFSAAKNYALSKATGNWIAFLDADEYFTKEAAKELIKLLMKIEKHMPEKEKPHMISHIMYHLNDQGEIFASSIQDRVIRNVKGIHYENRVHEMLKMSEGPGLIRLTAGKDLPIYHTGYAYSAVQRTKKALRNIEMLKRELEEHPEDYNLLAYLGDSYMSNEQFKEAEQCFKTVIHCGGKTVREDRLSSAFFGFLKIIVQRNQASDEDELNQIYEKALQYCPNYPDIDYWIGIWMTSQEQWDKAFFHLEAAVTKVSTYTGMASVYTTSQLGDCYLYLTMASQHLQDEKNVVKYGTLTLKEDKNNGNVLLSLLSLFSQEKDRIRTAAETADFLKRLYDFEQLRDKLFIIKYAKMVQFTELTAIMYYLLTREERAWLDS